MKWGKRSFWNRLTAKLSKPYLVRCHIIIRLSFFQHHPYSRFCCAFLGANAQLFLYQKGDRNISDPCAHILALYLMSFKFFGLPFETGKNYIIIVFYIYNLLLFHFVGVHKESANLLARSHTLAFSEK